MKNRTARIGWIVDVQNDFAKSALPGGRLYVRNLSDPADAGAELVEDNVVRAVEILREQCDALIYTGDWHSMEDPEIDDTRPDPAQGTYAPHCMGMSPDPAEREGAAIIPEIRPRDPLILERDASPAQAREIAHRAVREKRPVMIRKHQFSVFTGNPATDTFLLALQEELGGRKMEFYVLGHAREVCVTQFIDGVQSPERRTRGYHVVALRDAMWGLGLETEEETLRRWREHGGESLWVDELKDRLDASTEAQPD
jgi:nicotinamidase-related amidase